MQQSTNGTDVGAIYYAVVEGDFVQLDARTGQLEIYETYEEAAHTYPGRCEVIPVLVRRVPEAVDDQA